MRRANTVQRERWYDEKLQQASTPQEEFEVLRRRLAADVKRLPDELHNGVYASAVEAMQGVIESIADAIEHPVGVRE